MSQASNAVPVGILLDRIEDREKTKVVTAYPNFAILGKMGSGKTTAAKYLEAAHNYKVLHFAAALKSIARQIWGSATDNNRDLLQKFGVAVRDIDEDAWVNVLKRDVEKDWPVPLVVDDCRFPNEYEMLADKGFRFIRIHAEERVREDRLQRIHKIDDRSQMQHISETAIDDIEADYDIPNINSVERLMSHLDGILKKEEARV